PRLRGQADQVRATAGVPTGAARPGQDRGLRPPDRRLARGRGRRELSNTNAKAQGGITLGLREIRCRSRRKLRPRTATNPEDAGSMSTHDSSSGTVEVQGDFDSTQDVIADGDDDGDALPAPRIYDDADVAADGRRGRPIIVISTAESDVIDQAVAAIA